MSSKRAILYDAGRTLVRPIPQVDELWEFLGAQLGIDLASERALPDVGHFFYSRADVDGMGAYDSDDAARSFWANYYAQALLAAGVDRPREELVAAGEALSDWHQHPDRWEPYPEVLEALDLVQARGFVQGVISDWGTDLVPILHAHEVTKHLDFVVASAAVGTAKPHPDIFRHALARAELEPREVVYVGDSYISDILGARNVGIDAILVDREGRAPEVDCPVVSSLLDVLDHVD